MNKRQLVTTMMSAANGDQQAVVSLLEAGLPKLHESLDELQTEVQQRHAQEWEADTAREAAMNGQVTPAQTVGAFQDLYQSFLKLLTYTPAAFAADGGDVAAYQEAMQNALWELVLRLHNPTIRYAIVGGFEPEAREDVDEYLTKFGRELWGVALALSEPQGLSIEDLPPETAASVQQVSQAMGGE